MHWAGRVSTSRPRNCWRPSIRATRSCLSVGGAAGHQPVLRAGSVRWPREVLGTVRSRVTLPALRSYALAVEASIAYFAADLDTADAASAAVISDPNAMPMAVLWAAVPAAAAANLRGRPEVLAAAASRGADAALHCASGPQQYAISLSEACRRSTTVTSPPLRRSSTGSRPRRTGLRTPKPSSPRWPAACSSRRADRRSRATGFSGRCRRWCRPCPAVGCRWSRPGPSRPRYCVGTPVRPRER